jgi:hypothetical protein
MGKHCVGKMPLRVKSVNGDCINCVPVLDGTDFEITLNATMKRTSGEGGWDHAVLCTGTPVAPI